MIQDCSIEARLFFKILDNKDYSLLGKGTKEEQKQAFVKIYDEFFEIYDNSKNKMILRKQSRVEQAKFQIEYLSNWLEIYLNTPLNKEHREKLCKSLKEALEVTVLAEWDKNKVEKKINSEKRKREKKIIIEDAELKTLIKNNEGKFNFYDSLVKLEKAIDKDNIPEDVSLYKYIAYTKQIKNKKK